MSASAPRVAAEEKEANPWLPPAARERINGYGVMGPSFGEPIMFFNPRRSATEGTRRTGLARLVLTLAGAVLVSLAIAPSAAGRPDDAYLLRQHADSVVYCPLERIGDQFVKGDNLTGAGAPAPRFVPESTTATMPCE